MVFWHISRVISELCKPITSFEINLIVLLLLSINHPGKDLLNQRLYLCIALPKHIWTIIITAKQSVKRLERKPQSKTYLFHKLWLGEMDMSNAMKKNYSENERYSTDLGQCEHWDDGILCLRLILYLLRLSICSYAQTDGVFNPTNSLVPQCLH